MPRNHTLRSLTETKPKTQFKTAHFTADRVSPIDGTNPHDLLLSEPAQSKPAKNRTHTHTPTH